MKIYIVEDEKEISDNLILLLEQYGYEAVCCEDFKEVIADIKEHDPDLILLDVMLPFKDGYTICRKLREQMDTPVIMLRCRFSYCACTCSFVTGVWRILYGHLLFL